MPLERDLNLTQLRFLLEVIERGSYSEAALELNVSQSTISHAVQELEAALGARLLERGRHGAKPTALGERVALHARSVLASLEAMREEIALDRAALTGTLRVASVRSFATLTLPPILHAFGQAHPGVHFEMVDVESHPGGIEGGLLEGRADIGILARPDGDGLMSFELLRDDYLLVWPDDGRETPPGWSDIDTKSLMICDGECSRLLNRYFTGTGRTFKPTINTRDDSVILSMVAHGLGVAMMPAISTHPLPVGVRTYPLPEPLERVIVAAVTPTRYTSPVVKAFIAALRGTDYSALEPIARAPKPKTPAVNTRTGHAEARDTN
jgi:DNA-binding transcriptional LysR family regulator